MDIDNELQKNKKPDAMKMTSSKYFCKPKDKLDIQILKSFDPFQEIVEHPIETSLQLLR